MKRMLLVLVLVLALGCADDPDCTEPLSSTDDEGNPWPAYSAASAQLSDCAQLQGYSRQRGACSDGKRLIRKGDSFTGDTLYFDGETLVGRTAWSDIVSECDAWHYGDTRCDQAAVEETVCP